ncbi:SLIT-ROBO Rho GTPase-activating protein 3-like [Diadema setosum]|uniref:SLIT-ROBO Rho GTPase-activating protein 3-like n=1 Tax=Diadema setosum TaxID=31175 RepID=UPI003B3AFA9E
MTTDKKQERLIQQELETRIKDIRLHLSEQLKSLDNRAEAQRELISDYQDYFRQRSEIELQYAKDLEKLHDRTVRKQKQIQSQREKDSTVPSPQMCWNLLLEMTKNHHRQHTTLSHVYSHSMANRYGILRDELDSVYRKSREMTVEVHNEILRVLNELFAETKSYHAAHGSYKTMEDKMQQIAADLEKARKKGKRVKDHERQHEKVQQKLSSAEVKATRARNDYLLVTAAANATIQKYFGKNGAELVDCLDLGYVRKTQKMLYAFQASQTQLLRLQQEDLQRLELNIRSMSASKDKDSFLEAHRNAFTTPETFQFIPHGGDTTTTMVADIYPLSEELKSKSDNLSGRIKHLETDTNEIMKTLQDMQKMWADDTTNLTDEEVQAQFRILKAHDSNAELSRVPSMKRPRSNQEKELYFLGKFKENLEKGNALARMQSRQELMKAALGSAHESSGTSGSRPLNHVPKKEKLRERPGSVYMPLFGGDLQQYLDSGNFQIPPIVASCIEFITVYGLHHHGIFRLPGSHLEITDMKEQFERGKDPIYGLGEEGDVNVVASVLKAYFRELPEPLFPKDKFDKFMDCINLPPGRERIDQLRDMVSQLPTSVMILMRYLFAFLKKLSQYSDEHMMDTHNLALCFGPTLIRPPDGYDEVAYQGNINDLVETMILFQNEIFPSEPGPLFQMENNADLSPTGSLETIPESVLDETESTNDNPIIATAKEDYLGKSPDELTFSKGDTLKLYQRVDETWWKGSHGDQQGLVQQNYISLPDVESFKSLPGSLATSTSSSTTASPDHVRHHSDEARLTTASVDAALTPDIVRDVVRPYSPATTPLGVGIGVGVFPMTSSSPSTPTGGSGRKPPPVKPRPHRPKTSFNTRNASPSKSQTL